MENYQEIEGFCDICSINSLIVKLICTHKICIDCFIDFVYKALNSLELMLKRNISALNQRVAYLGCPYKCKAAELSMNLQYTKSLVKRSKRLTNIEVLRFNELAELGGSFFSGLRTYFYKCYMCERLKSNTRRIHIVCEECIKELYCRVDQVNKIKGVKIDFEIKKEDFDKNNLVKELFLVEFNEAEKTYRYQAYPLLNKNIGYYIPNFKFNGTCDKALLVRAVNSLNDHDHLVIRSHNAYEIQIVSLIFFTFSQSNTGVLNSIYY